MPYPLSYISTQLDRVSTLRKDSTWVAQQLTHPTTQLIPMWRNRNLIQLMGQQNNQPIPLTYSADKASHLLESATETVLLGVNTDGVTYVAVDLSSVKEKEALALVDGGGFLNIRQVGLLLDSKMAAILVYARGILHWHRQQQYCGRCGSPTKSKQGGHIRHCTNPTCGQQLFPRINPAVIMLVEHRPDNGEPPRCLLGRHRRSPEGRFSTLAGFVDMGESLEEAVMREVYEETGIRVGEVTYQASQPWPFPASMMVGFRARAQTTSIMVDEDEMAEARWFTAEELYQAGDWADETAGIRLSPKDSIARYLIDSWVAEVIGTPA